MIRSEALERLRSERYFRWRGGDVSRLEGITDAVIALAMTLLIVSLEVPASFDEMLQTFRQLPAFAVSFLVLGMVWFYHFQFHRRFGLETGPVIALNSLLLFLLLFYVYPLKFMFTVLFNMIFFGGQGFPTEDAWKVMTLYSAGYVGIFGCFLLMHLYAWRHRDTLELTAVERQVARGAMREHGIHVVVGSLSVVLALLPVAWGPPFSGLVYFALGPVQGIAGWMNGRKVERLAGR